MNGTDKSGMLVEQELTVADVVSSFLDNIRPISPLIRVIGRTAGTIGATIATVVIAHQVNLALSKERIRECTLEGNQDCEAGIPIVFYGQTFNGQPLGNTTNHIENAIKGGIWLSSSVFPIFQVCFCCRFIVLIPILCEAALYLRSGNS